MSATPIYGLPTRAVAVRPTGAAVVRAIALNTFREAMRDRVLYLLLVFALALIGVSRALSLLTVGNEEKIVKDIGLSAISFFGVLVAVFVGVSLVFKEIERRTVYTLLASPVSRWQFVTGKFAGLLAVLAMNVCLMSLALFVLLWWRGENPWTLAPAVLLIFIELVIVTAFSLLFSSITNPILAALMTFTVYLMGHLTWSLELLKSKVSGTAGAWLCDIAYWVLPNLERLDVKAQAVHGIALGRGHVALGVLYGLSYALVVLAAACYAFERKDFI